LVVVVEVHILVIVLLLADLVVVVDMTQAQDLVLLDRAMQEVLV
jgi:hypothetical protein